MDNQIEKELINSINEIEKLNTHSTYNIELKKEPLVSIVMTTYNVEKYINESIDSILNQTYSNLELIIVDDASSDDTVKIVKYYNDPRISLYQNKKNCGTYYSKNFGVLISRGEYIAIQDSDDISNLNRIKKQVDFLESYLSKQFVLCQYTRFDIDGKHLIEPRYAFQSSMFRAMIFHEIGYFDSVRVAADEEFNDRLILNYGPASRGNIDELLYFNRYRKESLTSTIKIGSESRTSYLKSYKTWHILIQKGQNPYLEYPLKKRPFDVDPIIDVPYSKEIETDLNISKLSINAEKITASLVTIPSRVKTLEKVINSIIEQVDILRVYLNNFETIPPCLKNEKITICNSKEYGEIADNGKYFNAETLVGFHFTIDDDIIYPSNYVEKLKSALIRYSFKPVIGLHGIRIKDSFKRYYDEVSREILSFTSKLEEDRYVHILGTGTVAYHTSSVHFNLDNIENTHMIDIYFGKYCQFNSIPMICIAREENWLLEIETPEETRIYDTFISKDEIQTEIVKSVSWNYQYLENDLKESINLNISIEERMLKKLDKFGIQLIENEKIIVNQKNTIEKHQNVIDWYSATYDHLPKWYLKIGSIFRRWPFS